MNKEIEIQTRLATAQDNTALLALLKRTPQMGSITLTFEREPNFFAGALVSCEHEHVLVAEDLNTPGVLIAMVDIGLRRQYIDGKVEAVRYLHDLRVAPEARGGKALRALFLAVADHTKTQEEWMEAVILEENLIPLGIIDRGRSWLPNFYPGGRVITSLIPAQKRKTVLANNLTIRAATTGDATLLQQLWNEASHRQGFPLYNVNDLLAGNGYYQGLKITSYLIAFINGKAVGTVGMWDQKPFKQTRVTRYTPWLAVSRLPYNLYSMLFGGIHLPPPGNCFDYLTLHSLTIDHDNPEVFKALLDYVIEHYLQPKQGMVCGFFDNHPLEAALEAYKRQKLYSRHFLISYQQDPSESQSSTVRHVEIARL